VRAYADLDGVSRWFVQAAKKAEKATKFRPDQKAAFVNSTPKGEKKGAGGGGQQRMAFSLTFPYDAVSMFCNSLADCSTALADDYDPPACEAAWYDWWEAKARTFCCALQLVPTAARACESRSSSWPTTSRRRRSSSL
jgi:hypothetical protein